MRFLPNPSPFSDLSIGNLRLSPIEIMFESRTMKFAICNEIFKDGTLAQGMALARKAGYDAIEIAPFTLANRVNEIPVDLRTEIFMLAQEAGIEVSGIHWVLAHTEGLHLNHPEAEVRERTSDYLCHLVDFCADIAGGYMIVGSPKQRNILTGVSHGDAWSFAAETFQKPLKQAKDRNITICFEPLAPEETNFINTASEAVRFAKQFRSPHFKVVLDVKAMCSETRPIPKIIRDSWPHFAYFHANDVNLKGPGFGDVDYRPIAAALKEVGYNGFVSVEVFKFDEGPEVIATKSLEYLKKVF
jgi:sugar phosphate isomerase/epimerase